jgi:hypothetical protein
LAVEYLARKRGLVGTLWNDVSAEAMNKNKGETIQIATPPSFTAASYNGISYTAQDINQSKVDVTLNKDFVVPVKISTRELKASANDIVTVSVAPAMDALLKQMDGDILTEFDVGDTTTPVPEAAWSVAQIELGIVGLQEGNVDAQHLAVSSFGGGELRQLDAIYSQDINRLNDNRNTAIGSYAGLDIFATNAISSAGVDVSNWMYHSTCATVAMRGLEVDDVQGMVYLFRTLYGVKTLDGSRIIKVITDGLGD